MTSSELLAEQPHLDAQLKRVGPVQFIRDLIMRLGGASLVSQGNSKLTPSKMATVFSYEDASGQHLRVSVVNELTQTGQNRYELLIEEE